MRRRSSILHDAYHEAGHAVVALGLGLHVSSVWVVTSGRGILGGRAQLGASAYQTGAVALFGPLPAHESTIADLAGDAADMRRRVVSPLGGADHRQGAGLHHLLAAMDDLGDDAARLLYEEAATLVQESWLDIERMARVLASGRDLYDLTPETWREAIA
jgi:hypothetical protein